MTKYLHSLCVPAVPFIVQRDAHSKRDEGIFFTENQFNCLIPTGFPEQRGVTWVSKFLAKFLGGEHRNGRERSSQPSGQMILMCHQDPWWLGLGIHQGNWQFPPGQSLQKSGYSNAGNCAPGMKSEILEGTSAAWGLGRAPIPQHAAIAWDTYLSIPSSELLFSTKSWILLHSNSIYFMIKGDEK